ncbi:MAG: glycoside hydrolase family 30 protein [Caldicoprobacterales bacterium]
MRKLVFDPSKQYQAIDNFGASACWWTDPAYESLPGEDMDEIARLLFDRQTGAGLSCIRFNIGGGSSWYDREFIENWMMRAECFQIGPKAPYDWTRHAGQQWLIQRAKEMGVERTIAFVNSPPAWLCENGHTRCDEQTGTTNLKHGAERQFGRYLADILKHFQDKGLPFDYISPINEPQVPWDTPKQEGCRYSNEDTIRTVLAVKRELDAAGVTAKLLINETNNPLALVDLDLVLQDAESLIPGGIERGWQFGGKYCENIKDIFNLSCIRDAVAPIIASHSYGSDIPGKMTKIRQLVMATMERYPGYDYWMTEYCILGEYGLGRDLGMAPALYISRVIHADLTVLNAAAWQWWLAVSGADYKDGLIYIDLDEQGNYGGFYTSKMLWALAHYARFLRPGSVRVELTGGDSEDGLLVTGWLNTEDKAVIVLVNTKDVDETVEIVGGADRWRMYRTSDEEDMADCGIAGNTITLNAGSITTLYENMSASG